MDSVISLPAAAIPRGLGKEISMYSMMKVLLATSVGLTASVALAADKIQAFAPVKLTCQPIATAGHDTPLVVVVDPTKELLSLKAGDGPTLSAGSKFGGYGSSSFSVKVGSLGSFSGKSVTVGAWSVQHFRLTVETNIVVSYSLNQDFVTSEITATLHGASSKHEYYTYPTRELNPLKPMLDYANSSCSVELLAESGE